MISPWKKALAISLTAVTLGAQARSAAACGCFAPPSPMTPVVQAGERILFAHDGDQIVAYIQIQYQGAADQFGWIVPMPSIPTLELATDELFTKLGAQTNPQYNRTTNRNFCGGGSSRASSIGCGSEADSASGSFASDLGAASFDAGSANNTPVVVQSSIGPYDYAVLKADDKTEMLKWLSDNRYYVPDATGAAVAPYIHPGAYFLALKLRAGQDAGDVVPVVLRYTSDLPMIPITLTSVGAIPNMGVLVWSLGEARAIPRNYYHVVLDDIRVWANTLNYPNEVVRAIHEAPGRHAFLTEYAGTSAVMQNQLDFPGRFGNLTQLRKLTDPGNYLTYLRNNSYTFDGTLFSLLERYLPEPQDLIANGISEAAFYSNYDFYITQGGEPDAGVPPTAFDAGALTDEITTRIVKPTRAAALLFSQHPYLTRLYTALSPEDMNLDPVFSENPDLPDVPRTHAATLTFPCTGDAWLKTESDMEVQYVSGLAPSLAIPSSLRVERLREAGAPEIVTDNEPAIRAALGSVDHGSSPNQDGSGSGCAYEARRAAPSGALGTLMMIAGAIWLARRRRPV